MYVDASFAKPLQLETSHLDLSVMLSLMSKFTLMLQFAHLSRWIWNLVELVVELKKLLQVEKDISHKECNISDTIYLIF